MTPTERIEQLKDAIDRNLLLAGNDASEVALALEIHCRMRAAGFSDQEAIDIMRRAAEAASAAFTIDIGSICGPTRPHHITVARFAMWRLARDAGLSIKDISTIDGRSPGSISNGIQVIITRCFNETSVNRRWMQAVEEFQRGV